MSEPANPGIAEQFDVGSLVLIAAGSAGEQVEARHGVRNSGQGRRRSLYLRPVDLDVVQPEIGRIRPLNQIRIGTAITSDIESDTGTVIIGAGNGRRVYWTNIMGPSIGRAGRNYSVGNNEEAIIRMERPNLEGANISG